MHHTSPACNHAAKDFEKKKKKKEKKKKKAAGKERKRKSYENMGTKQFIGSPYHLNLRD